MTAKRTALYNNHVELKAKIVDFHGWEMPIQYEGILAEHQAVRNCAGLFDVSHMGELFLSGPDSESFLNYVTTNNLSNVEVGQAQYNCLPTPEGCLLDDLIIYRLEAEKFMLCVNASNIDKDFNQLKSQSEGYDIHLENRSDEYSLISLQGPEALKTLNELMKIDLSDVGYYRFINHKFKDQNILIARLGYTGADGFELLATNGLVCGIWQDILNLNPNILPCGLGARDTLRLEAGFPLYGNDLDEEHNAYESNLGFIVKLAKDDFIGKQALQNAKESGIKRKLQLFIVLDKGLPRKDQTILDEAGNTVGIVTSGGYLPDRKIGVGMGYLPPSPEGSRFQIQSGNRVMNIETRKKLL